jgi:cell division transport system permease protein
VVSAASDWQSDVGREVTIQVRPAPGRDVEADVRKAAEIARATPGVADVRAYTKQESARLVEPWLGGGLSLDDLPIPRLIVVKLASGVLPDFEALLALVLAVTVLSVTFATRGAMATNRPIIEVLHYVGATDGFIAGQFQRHFLLLGFKGGAIGGGAAIFFFGAAEAANAWLAGTAGGDQAAALFGNVSIGVSGYLAILTQVILMAMVTALASRRTVNRTLETMD